MTKYFLTIDNVTYTASRTKKRTTVTTAGRRGIVTWHKNKRKSTENIRESEFRIKRKIVEKRIIDIEPPKPVPEKISFRSLVEIAYDTPLGKAMKMKVWKHTEKATMTDMDLMTMLEEFIDFLFAINEAAAQKIRETAVETSYELNRRIEPDEVMPPDAKLDEQLGHAQIRNYTYYARGKPFARVPFFEVSE